MKACLSFLMLLGASAAPVVVHAAAPVPSPQPAQGQRAAPPPAAKIPGVSDAGNAILAKAQSAPDPQLAGLARQQRAVRDQIVGAVMAPTIDMAKLGALLKQQQGLIGQVLARRDERLLQAAAQLTPADRSVFLRALITAQPGQASH